MGVVARRPQRDGAVVDETPCRAASMETANPCGPKSRSASYSGPWSPTGLSVSPRNDHKQDEAHLSRIPDLKHG